jgi:CheY-like chemotaxis protein
MTQDGSFAPPDPNLFVLVVEDEPIVRLAAMESVAEAGFTPVEAWDAAEAVRILEVRTDIQIVFTDIDMPGGLNGVQLAAAIRDRWPPINIILTSGNLRPAAELLPQRAIFLPKPYTDQQLDMTLKSFA